MYIFLEILFFIFSFLVFWAIIGYPFSLKILDKLLTKNELPKNYNYQPTITILIVAHNEESVIKEKLENVSRINYPKEKLEILISSDNSTDTTNEIVEDFIVNNQDKNIRIYKAKNRKGKTNAQNEAVRTIKSELIVFTDANAMLDKNACIELAAAFYDESIAYVTGKLCYTNRDIDLASESESSYWDLDLALRDIESRFQTITAGNGALYACKRKDYVEFDPIKSHDSSMPLYYSLNNKNAIANHDALAFEKAGENIKDEFNRKVRMSRIILASILPSLKILNVFRYKWFTYFYLGHRTSRYLLWFSHIMVLLLNMILINESSIYVITFGFQLVFYTIAVLRRFFYINNRFINMIYYYCMTLYAQIVGVMKVITGKAKPTWEKAGSTR
ncbi:glycosyltransferase family 2 protein [Halobacillus naozhouensis]|uniref:Glycosyltransferase family 2 protein n=1 Tax=Halobacillus naozhouensis TaxID=554880 RepID=A0ABY8IVR2_9BACI|nr:glycosyltransferase family 2 protein [Halobacillus naozhouensis]WFT74297.1 glycosyltransferase family 2 protein [Halobacillus naozhouensis]